MKSNEIESVSYKRSAPKADHEQAMFPSNNLQARPEIVRLVSGNAALLKTESKRRPRNRPYQQWFLKTMHLTSLKRKSADALARKGAKSIIKGLSAGEL